jgi:GNAT superfamily N-acetyltransferase
LTSHRSGVLAVSPLDLVKRVDEAVAIQSAALGPVSSDRASIFVQHTSYREFRAFGGFLGDRLVGFTYGTLCEPGQWWHDQIGPALVAAGHQDLLADAYAVTELHVLPEFHGRGLGRALLSTLVRGVPHASTLLSTYDQESRARTLYRHLGFVDLVTRFRFPMQFQRYALMGAWLPLRESG